MRKKFCKNYKLRKRNKKFKNHKKIRNGEKKIN